ncbi:MAG TPA: ABC transporter substrate-binding protein [Xanthobacteraceae bacterium]|nr:ABC transporter substrate-binding protein [Xanthobacteraceae bacterium]
MKRREFITLLGGAAAAWPLAAGAQQVRPVRVGYLGLTSIGAHAERLGALQAGLRDLGYVEGKSIVLEYRWAEGRYDLLNELAAELVRANVDVIVTHGTPGVLAAKHATSTIPIVIAAVGDAVASGLVTSISRPGGNVTGMTYFHPELAAKRLELVKEAVPTITKVGVLINPLNPMNEPILPEMKQAADALKVELLPLRATEPGNFEGAFTTAAAHAVGALVLLDDPVFTSHPQTLAQLAIRQRLPSSGFIESARAGGLLAYGVSFPEMWRHVATYIDKIAKGAKPADLPIELPTRFRTIVNLRTAKAIEVEVPTSLLLRADEVIE